MKTLFIALISLFTIISAKTIQETQVITAKYLGFKQGSYSFEDENEEVINFDSIYDLAEQKFNLESEDYINKTFIVTYETSIEENEESEESFESKSISDLELSK